jgi:hypothetical protein
MMHVRLTKARQQRLRFPADASDHDEIAVVFAARAQTLERIEQNAEIFARLDRADEKKIASGKSFDRFRRRGRGDAGEDRDRARRIDFDSETQTIASAMAISRAISAVRLCSVSFCSSSGKRLNVRS